MTGTLVVLSNRGPVSWARQESGELVPRRGAGGLVSALGPALRGTGGTWIASALGPEDRAAVAAGLPTAADEGFDAHLLNVPEEDLSLAVDIVANQYLWYAHHDLWNRPWAPSFGTRAWEAWDAYVRVNDMFVEAALAACAGESRPTVLVQDYHLALVPGRLKEHRPDLQVLHFSHTPFATASALSVLPSAWVRAVVSGIAASDVCGFHTRRWAERFLHAAHAVLGPQAATRTAVFPLGPDPDNLRAEAAGPDVAAERRVLEARIRGRRAIVRVDRAELSKNVLRGLRAYDDLLARRRDLVKDLVHVVLLNPSRQGLADYRQYLQNTLDLAEELNERYGGDAVIIHVGDRYPRSLAALKVADVIMANPISDGMNLVAKEGPLINERDAPLVLSTEAGAFEEVGDVSIAVNPFDVRGTSLALEAALACSGSARTDRASKLRKLCAAHPPSAWIAAQLEALRP